MKKVQFNLDEIFGDFSQSLSATDLDEELKKEMKTKHEKTNFTMYKEMRKLFKQLKNKDELAYEAIDQIFNLERREKLDLENLREFIVCMAVANGQNILKARIAGDIVKEKKEIAEHKELAQLTSKLADAIGSAIYTNFE